MFTFEVHPHRVRGIGQAAGGKSIRGQQIAELILKVRLRYRQKRKEMLESKRKHANQDHVSVRLRSRMFRLSPAISEHPRIISCFDAVWWL